MLDYTCACKEANLLAQRQQPGAFWQLIYALIAPHMNNFLVNKLGIRQDQDLPTGGPACETLVLITPLLDSTLLNIHVIALTNTALF